jgi:hypothetical protein
MRIPSKTREEMPEALRAGAGVVDSAVDLLK